MGHRWRRSCAPFDSWQRCNWDWSHPQEQRDHLRALQDLYLRPDPNNTMSAEGDIRRDDPVQSTSTRIGPYTTDGPSDPTSTGRLSTSGTRDGPHMDDSGLEGQPPPNYLGHKGTVDSAVDVRTRNSSSARHITWPPIMATTWTSSYFGICVWPPNEEAKVVEFDTATVEVGPGVD
jgi:hypothetical protein